MKLLILLTFTSLDLFATLATARLACWYRPDGPVFLGGSTFTCTNLHLGLYGAERLLCGACACPSIGFDRIVLSERGTSQVRFSNALDSVG